MSVHWGGRGPGHLSRWPKAAVPPFNPATIYAGGRKGLWLDPSDFSTLFQDSGMTQPVTTVGQTVTKQLDKSGNGFTVTYTGCTLAQDVNGAYYIAPNGTTSGGSTASIDFTTTDKISVVAGVRTTTNAGNQAIVELSANSTTATGAFLMYMATGNRISFLRQTANVTLTASGRAPTNIAVVYTDLFDIAGATATDEVKMRANSAALSPTVTAAGPAGTGNFGNYPLYLFARNGSSLRLTGGMYGLILCDYTLTGDLLAGAEQWVSGRSGFNAIGTRAIMLGDSTIAAYLGTTAVLDYVGTSLTKTSLADEGDTINEQRLVFAASAFRDDARWVCFQIGLNDLDPAEAASVAIARMQTLVDTVRICTRPRTLKVMSLMDPCRARMIALYGPVNGEIAYQKWTTMNEAYAGLGPTPVTGVDVRVTAHVPLMSDGSGNLLPIYDTGDGIHPNNAGRAVNGQAITNALTAAGVLN